MECGEGVPGRTGKTEVYGYAADRQQASIVFEVVADMVQICPALNRRVKILVSQKIPEGSSFYDREETLAGV